MLEPAQSKLNIVIAACEFILWQLGKRRLMCFLRLWDGQSVLSVPTHPSCRHIMLLQAVAAVLRYLRLPC